MNKVCLCQSQLNKGKGIICRNCLRESKRKPNQMYRCYNKNCIYKKMAGADYWMCKKCYRSYDAEYDNNTTEDQVQFMCNKVLSSLNTISYVIYMLYLDIIPNLVIIDDYK